LPGYYSDTKTLGYNYTITNYEPNMITLQVNFDNPLLVSSLDDPDKIQINFNGYYFFFT